MIPFNKPFMTGKELGYIAEAHQNNVLAGDGPIHAALSCVARTDHRLQ